MDSMKTRIITAAVSIPIVVGLLLLGEFFNWIIYLAFSLLSVILVFELLSAKKLHRNFIILIPCSIYAFLQPLLVLIDVGYVSVYLFVIVLFFVMILNSQNIQYSDVTFSLVGTLIITLGLSCILCLFDVFYNYYSFTLLLCLGVPWFSDGGAYFAGVFLGKHKLCPNVSPNKTVEGFIGGIIAGTLSTIVIGSVFSLLLKNADFNYVLLVIIGFSASVVSVLGDLSFSIIKRSCNIKDYGTAFPGHGGFLDRFDSVIFTAPLIYFLCSYFPLFTF